MTRRKPTRSTCPVCQWTQVTVSIPTQRSWAASWDRYDQHDPRLSVTRVVIDLKKSCVHMKRLGFSAPDARNVRRAPLGPPGNSTPFLSQAGAKIITVDAAEMFLVHYEYDLETAVKDVKRQMGGSRFIGWQPVWDYGRIGQSGRGTARHIIVPGADVSGKNHIIRERCPHGCRDGHPRACSGCESGVIPKGPQSTIKVWDKWWNCHFDISAATIDNVSVRDVDEPAGLGLSGLADDILTTEEVDVFECEAAPKGKAQKDDVEVTDGFLVESDDRAADPLGIPESESDTDLFSPSRMVRHRPRRHIDCEKLSASIKSGQPFKRKPDTKRLRTQIVGQNPWQFGHQCDFRWVVESGKYKGQDVSKTKHRKNILRKAVPVLIPSDLVATNRPTGEIILVSPLPAHLEQGLVTVFGKREQQVFAFGHHGHGRAANKTPGRAKADPHLSLSPLIEVSGAGQCVRRQEGGNQGELVESERLNEIQGLCGAGLDHATGEFVAWDEAQDLITKWDFPDGRNQPMDFRT